MIKKIIFMRFVQNVPKGRKLETHESVVAIKLGSELSINVDDIIPVNMFD